MAFSFSVNRRRSEVSLELFTMDIDKLMRINLERLLAASGLKQNRLAELVGVHPSVINDILGDRRPIGKDTLMRLCKALGVGPWEFYIDESTPVVTDNKEREALKIFREAGPLHVAEEIQRYGKFLVKEAKERDSKDPQTQKGRSRIHAPHPGKGK